jgi:hypothetical protein
MVYPGDGARPSGRQALRHPYPDQEAAGESRPAGDGNQLYVCGSRARALECEVEEAWQAFEMISRSELRDHSSVLGVQVDL